MVADEIKRLSESVKTLGVELRDVDRRVARLEGILVGQAQATGMTRKRIEGGS
jgi:hypothetical protein